MKVYIDCEFDAVWSKGKFIQCVVSIGAVASDDKGKELGRFYSLICPYRFKRLTRVVKKMTQLQNEDILKAEDFKTVIHNFTQWMDRKDKKRTLYSFGPDDKRTLLSHAAYEQYKETDWITMHDLQRDLSATILYEKRMVSPTLSLDDVKYAYNVLGEVNHNALNDAVDLMHCHQQMLKKTLNMNHIQEIWERKEAKRIEIAEREKARMKHILIEKYGHSDGKTYEIALYHNVIEQLMVLEERQHPFKMMFYEEELLHENMRYSYKDMRLLLCWHIQEEIPYIELQFHMKETMLAYKLFLNYGNASILDGISHVAKNYIVPQVPSEE